MTQRAYTPGLCTSIVAAGAITAEYFVGFDNAVAAAQGEAARGVAIRTADAAGDTIDIAISGEIPVLTGTDVATNNLAVGSPVTTAADGTVMLAATADEILGRALEASSAAGESIIIDFGREGVSA